MKLNILLIIFLSLTIIPHSVQAQWTAQITPQQSHTKFTAIGHPSSLKITGKGEGIEGTANVQNGKVTGNFYFKLESLDTGIKMRNTHMKDKYLDVMSYPQAQFEINTLDLKTSLSSENYLEQNIPFKGKLTLHGVTNDISGTANFDKKSTSLRVDTQFSLKISDFKIDVPTYAGITLADEVMVYVDFSTTLIPKK